MKKLNRRVFARNISGMALGITISPWTLKTRKGNEIQKRVLGRTGEKVSILTTGGFHLGVETLAEEESIRMIRTSIDEGVNFMDNAWVYQEGRSETYMGKALKDGYRKRVLLMTKFMARTVEDAKEQLETSLKRLDMDSFDLMQFHAIGNFEGDVDAIYKNGLIEWAEEQRSHGVFKYIGFTGHAHPKFLIEMINRGYPWDTVQLPLNPGDYHQKLSFQNDVIPLAVENNIGVIGMKSNGGGRLGKSKIATPVDGLRYAMSLPVSTVVSGMDSMEVMEQNLEMFQNFKPITEKERDNFHSLSAGKSDVIEGYRKKV
jgi:predicted aldo/keto reductase-like oxidoreductase